MRKDTVTVVNGITRPLPNGGHVADGIYKSVDGGQTWTKLRVTSIDEDDPPLVVTDMGCVHRADRPYPALAVGRSALWGRFAAGCGKSGRRPSSQANRSRGFWPKKRSAAVVPSARWLR